MFGDNLIIGSKIVNIDSKGRIVIPKFSGVEKGETLLFLINENGILTIDSLNNFKKELELLKNIGISSITTEGVMNYLYSKALGCSNVDAVSRVIIPSFVRETYLNDTKQIVFIGAGTKLNLFKNVDEYKSYIKK